MGNRPKPGEIAWAGNGFVILEIWKNVNEILLQQFIETTIGKPKSKIQ